MIYSGLNYLIYLRNNRGSRDSVVDIVNRRAAARSGVYLSAGHGTLLFKTSRRSLGPTQHLVQKVPAFLPRNKTAGA
jgi:hypothetical protein